MKTSVVVLAVLSLAILVSVSGRNVVQARDVWPGPDGVTATDGIHPGEAVITWSTVEKAAYYRIGWVAQADREVGTDGDAKWREGFVFADVANRGQASHLITGLAPGVEYDFVVASHDGRWSRLPGTGGLASLRLGEDPSYFRLFDAAEAEVALEPVEEGPDTAALVGLLKRPTGMRWMAMGIGGGRSSLWTWPTVGKLLM